MDVANGYLHLIREFNDSRKKIDYYSHFSRQLMHLQRQKLTSQIIAEKLQWFAFCFQGGGGGDGSPTALYGKNEPTGTVWREMIGAWSSFFRRSVSPVYCTDHIPCCWATQEYIGHTPSSHEGIEALLGTGPWDALRTQRMQCIHFLRSLPGQGFSTARSPLVLQTHAEHTFSRHRLTEHWRPPSPPMPCPKNRSRCLSRR